MSRIRCLTSALALVLASTVIASAAAATFSVRPAVYDPGETGIITAKWNQGVGVNGGYGFILAKDGVTSTDAAAFGVVRGEAGATLIQLGFDVRANTYCGAGAPRFNVTPRDGDTTFFGCSGMTTTQSYTDSKGQVWLWKRADIGTLNGQALGSIYLVQDEQGRAVVDNISINNQTIGSPS